MPRPIPKITQYPLPGYVTFINYADHRGLSTARISHIIKAGTLEGCYIRDELNRFHIDQKKADEILDKWSPQKEMAANRKREAGKVVAEERPVPAKPERYSDAKTGNEVLKFQMNKLAYEERKGTLINAEQVKNELFIMARTLREQLMSIPDRLAPGFSAEKDERKIRIEMENEIRKALARTDEIVREVTC